MGRKKRVFEGERRMLITRHFNMHTSNIRLVELRLTAQVRDVSGFPTVLIDLISECESWS